MSSVYPEWSVPTAPFAAGRVCTTVSPVAQADSALKARKLKRMAYALRFMVVSVADDALATFAR
jgi:hypothetical protein